MEMDLKSLQRAIDQVSEEKGIDPARVLEAIESSIAAAYKKEYEKKGEIIKAAFDTKTGALKFWQVKTVVDETLVRFEEEKDEEAEEEGGKDPAQRDPLKTKTGSPAERESLKPKASKEEVDPAVEASREKDAEEGDKDDEEKLPRFNPVRHIILEDAKKEKKGAKIGEELEFPLKTHEDFGRIAAQAAKQVILQKLREAERESIVTEFKDREGEIVSGLVQRFERGNTYIDLGRATGVMPYREGIPGEHYRIGERLKFHIAKVDDESRVPAIILSRADENFVRKLFEVEIPEIQEGLIEIKGVAREPGSRSKVAVVSSDESIDPVGSCVGQRGTRIMAVSNELGQEKIDVIDWSEDPVKFITASLSPAEVASVEILKNNEAIAIVPDDELSLAIGRGGQNVRLAARLTGWKIDVRSASNPDESHKDRKEEEEKEKETVKEEKVDKEEKPAVAETKADKEAKEEKPKKKKKGKDPEAPSGYSPTSEAAEEGNPAERDSLKPKASEKADKEE